LNALAIIPARGGSKRIERKNIRSFCGRPIISYAIGAALEAGCFEEVMVSTDNEEIAGIARELGAQVPFMRSARTADDHATTASVWQEVINLYGKQGRHFSTVCSILPTAPFVSAGQLTEAIRLLESRPDWDAVMPVVAYSPPIQRAFRLGLEGNLEMLWTEHLTTRSQDLEPRYYDAGQYYAFRPEFILKKGSLRLGKLGPILLSPMQVQDIDTEEDWALAELKYRVLNSCV